MSRLKSTNAIGFICRALLCLLPTTPHAAESPEHELLLRAISVRPSPKQLAWQRQEITSFIHFGMNTFHGHELGTGREDPKTFDPTSLDCTQWVEASKSFGAGTLIMVAKHHDGFCLWPSKFTEHSVRNSPWKGGRGDVLADLSLACKNANLGFGLYLSPADLNHPAFARRDDEYNAYFKSQLRELLTNYGPIKEIWFDGAQPKGRAQRYDWAGYYALIRELQPSCLISIRGPDSRWVGNESGQARLAEWSVIPIPATIDAYDWPAMMDFDLGSRQKLQHASALHWYPAVAAVPLRPHWFYLKKDDSRVMTVRQLVNLYYTTVGRNAVLLLNLSPDQHGRIPELDRHRLGQWASWRNSTFATNLTQDTEVSSPDSGTLENHPPSAVVDQNLETWWQPPDWQKASTLHLQWRDPVEFDLIRLREAIQMGQRIERFAIEARVVNIWKVIAEGETVGASRILPLREPILTSEIRILFKEFRVAPMVAEVSVHLQKQIPD